MEFGVILLSPQADVHSATKSMQFVSIIALKYKRSTLSFCFCISESDPAHVLTRSE